MENDKYKYADHPDDLINLHANILCARIIRHYTEQNNCNAKQSRDCIIAGLDDGQNKQLFSNVLPDTDTIREILATNSGIQPAKSKTKIIRRNSH